jgi:hypothetical protein
VEEVTVTDEDEYFPLPPELRELLRQVSAAAALSLFAPSATAPSSTDELAASDMLDSLAG